MATEEERTRKIEYNPEELKKFEERMRTFSEEEINRKIKQWFRRIEQFVALDNKRKGRRLYAEIKVMVKVLKEMTALDGDITGLSISGDILAKAAKVVDMIGKSLSDYNRQELISAPDILFKFLSTEESIDKIYELMREKFEVLPIDEMERINLDVAVTEAVGNAHRHGHKYKPNLVVELRYLYVEKEHKVIMQVSDQGDGFDAKSVLEQKREGSAVEEARTRYKSGGYGGLGIMMMLKCVDQVDFNEQGNQITLTKKFQSQSSV